ncbi:MAG: DUF3037 domain-containing protein [Novosphingobium sp.]|nr:DUF3037 domain-containing protein [Novosphingobium sp.]
MAKSYRFGVLRFASHPLKSEVLNVALLLESEDGLQVRVARRLEKIRAISAALDVNEISEELNEIPKILNNISDDIFDSEFAVKMISDLTCFTLSYRGDFDVSSPALFESVINDLMLRYVEPEPAQPKPVRKRHTRLRQDILQALRAEKILARPSEGLDSHRVIYKHHLAQGIVADFVLQNGAMHVVESVDASTETATVQRSLYEIAMSTLTFEHARINFENRHVKPRLIYNSSLEIEKALAPSLYAAQHQGAEIVNWASEKDRMQFLATFSSLADSTDEQKSHPNLFHASALPTRKLN